MRPESWVGHMGDFASARTVSHNKLPVFKAINPL